MRILGYDVRIIEKEDALRSLNLGTWSSVKSEIVIDINAAKCVREETILHEVIESINSICQLELNHKELSTLSAVLHQVLVDNGGDISTWK